MVEKNRVEKIHCGKPNCKTPVADRRADGAIIRCVRHRGKWHVTVIAPSREKLSLPGWMRGVEKIRCDEINCTIVVAELRADGTIIIRDEHHEREHVTIIPPWPSAPPQDLADDAAKTVMAPDTSILP
jgi:hypothetical protein